MIGIEKLHWRTAQKSNGNSMCVEVAACDCPGDPRFRKSARSGGSYSCVEAGNGSAVILVRDTKQAGQTGRTVLAYPAAAWRVFTDGIKGGAL